MINDSHLTGPGLIISCRASSPLLLPCFTGRRVTDCPSTRIGFHVLMGGGVYETKLDYKEWTTITTTTTTIQLRSVCLCLVSLSKWPNVEYNHPQLVSTQLETDHSGMRFAWDTHSCILFIFPLVLVVVLFRAHSHYRVSTLGWLVFTIGLACIGLTSHPLITIIIIIIMRNR